MTVGYSRAVEFKVSAARIDRLEEERRAQQAWRLKHPGYAPVIEGFIRREFLEPQAASDLEALELQRIIGYARARVPFYRDHQQWREARFDGPVDRALLASLPVIVKTDLRENFEAFRSAQLPSGERVLYETRSSGTSGTPARVLFSQHAGLAFGLLSQRMHRWERFDPRSKQAVIRQARVLPHKDGAPLKDGEILRQDGWMYVRDFFQTGPQVAITRGNPLEFQLKVLRDETPVYLATSPSLMEALVYAAQGKPVDSLQGLRTLAATLPEAVRRQIETSTGLPIQQPYGLNEIGAVATRCPAGRYHVNAEHCVVEVVDENQQPCKPGELGRVLVTGLTNVAMPLIRYDTGDLAEAVAGDCPCGRTLPAFGRILGRYRPTSHAPPETTRRMDLLFYVLRTLPLDVLQDLREYQLHQYRDGHFELRLNCRGEPDARLLAALRQAWDEQAGDVKLDIVRVEAIPRVPGQKTQDFTSDFFPSINAGA